MNFSKNKFHLAKRPVARHGAGQGSAASTAVALVDERYLAWLATQQTDTTAVLQRHALHPVLAHLARALGPDATLLRACLYTDQPPAELLDDVLIRTVPAHSLDGGLGLVRALGLELTQLAERGACHTVLLASDDERLIPYLDEAQWRGLRVVLVTDESAQDFARLRQDDPSWARLLMQADRRVALDGVAWQALTTPGAVYAPLAPEPHPEAPYEGGHASPGALADVDWRAQVEQVIRDWWAEETPHARLDLYEEMHNSQGVPPETDRHLLLRVRRELARTLSFTEKKVMREMIRATVMAAPPEASVLVSADA
jgi:hypothetical protein